MTRSRDVASNGGMVLLNTTTVSGSSGITVNNLFSSTYDQYFMVWSGTSSNNSEALWARFSTGGTANSETLYFYGGTYVTNSSGPSRDMPVAQNKTLMGHTGDISGSVFAYINNPYIAVPTTGNYLQNYWGSNLNFASQYGFSHNKSVSYDGINLFPGGGTFTGTFKFYGIKK